MTVRDTFALFLLFLGGFTLIASSVYRWVRAIPLPAMASRYAARHRELTRTLARAGWIRSPGVLLVDPVRCWIGAQLTGISVLVFLWAANPAPIPILLAVPAAVLSASGCLLLSLKSAAHQALSEFRQDLPLAAFLMSLLMESGMGSAAAMRETVDALPSRGCARELREVLRGREVGASRRELFEQSRSRVPIEEHRAFLNLIEQGERLGVGLSRGLGDLSSRMMESQAHRAEMYAQQAAVKLLLPLVLFIFPSVLLVILSPVILNLCGLAGW